MRRFLHKRGVPTAHHDDLLQDVALVALRGTRTFEGADDLTAWAMTVSLNGYRTTLRRNNRTDLTADIPTRVTDDVERRATARLALDAVLAAAAALPADDQAQILGTAQTSPDLGERNRLAVRRHRARIALRAIGASFLSILVLAARRLKLAVAVPTAIATVLLVAAIDLHPDDGAAGPPQSDALESIEPADEGDEIPSTPDDHSLPEQIAGGAPPRQQTAQAHDGAPATPTTRPTVRVPPTIVYLPPGTPVKGVEVSERTDKDSLICIRKIPGGLPDQCFDPPLPRPTDFVPKPT